MAGLVESGPVSGLGSLIWVIVWFRCRIRGGRQGIGDRLEAMAVAVAAGVRWS